MASSNIINAVFGSGICAVTTSAFRANYGMKLRFSGIDLPAAFEVDFSNYDTMGRDSITMIGQNGEVQIPDDLWDSGLNIYAYVYLHPTDDSGVTVYTVTIPVLGRPNRTEETPTPHEQTVIEQAISALNDAVEQTAADVASADASAQAAAQSEANASVSERAAAASASAALASQNAAESAQQGATEQALASAESARNAALSASAAAESATAAQESAEQAERSVQSITDDVERAERAAASATGKATEAAQSATDANTSAEFASAWAANAAEAVTDAQEYANDAEQAKTAAQDAQAAAEQAQAAAEQAAESISDKAAQIEQNTADIADLVQTKAGALIDTASGSIASFYPDSTIPTVKGLTVNVEPVQDLHGYDSPWPAGGGKNLLDINNIVVGNTTNWSVDVNGDTLTVTHKTAYTTGTPSFAFNQPSGTYVVSIGSINITGQVSLYVNGSWAKTINNNDTFTIDAANTNEIKFSAQENQVTIITKIQIESGSTATSYAPYSNICPISGWDAVEVDRTGVNLWGGSEFLKLAENWTNAVVDTEAMTLTGKVQDLPTRANIFEFPFKQNTKYTIFVQASVTNTGLYAVYTDGAEASIATTRFVSNPNKTLAYLRFYIATSSPITFYANGIGVFEGDVSVDAFTPYLGQTYQIQLGQTVYGGTIDVKNGVLTVDRAMVDLGTLTWQQGTTRNDGAFRFSTMDIPSAETADTAHPTAITSQYPLLIQGGTFNATENGFTIGSGRAWIYDVAYKTLTAANFKTAMSGVQLVYKLTTPITISLTPIEISVLTGQTNNIWADSGDVSVEYAADLKTYINNKIAAAVAALS